MLSLEILNLHAFLDQFFSLLLTGSFLGLSDALLRHLQLILTEFMIVEVVMVMVGSMSWRLVAVIMRRPGSRAPVPGDFKSELGEFILNRPLIVRPSWTAAGTGKWAGVCTAILSANMGTAVVVQARSVVDGDIGNGGMALGASAMETRSGVGVSAVRA
jgi:hypothetical protein